MTGYFFAMLIAMSASMPCRMLQLLLQVRSSPWETLLQKKKSCSDMLQQRSTGPHRCSEVSVSVEEQHKGRRLALKCCRNATEVEVTQMQGR
jgi:hypothetical protein